MSFLNPLVLAGLAAISVPIAIHLLNKFRVQKTRWAAMRFVQDCLQRNRRRLQIEDLLLLILRCLAVAALVIAFARPVLKTLVPGLAGGEGPAATVVLLDNSASMGQSNGVETRFEQGTKAIRGSIEQVEPGSLYALYLVSNRTDALIAQPGSDMARFRRSLELAQTSDRSTDLARGIRTAYEALKPMTDRRREIVVYTDSQISAWNQSSEIQKLAQDNPSIALKPMPLGQTGEDNLAVVSLQTEGGVPAANQPCRFRIDVANYGTKPAEGIRVTLSVDGNPPSDETLIPRIEPGATQSASLFVRFTSPGFHTVTAAIPPDRLPVDNERTTALQVVDRMRVLIAEGNPGALPAERDGYFLANALAPVSPDRSAQYYLSISTVPATDLAKKTLTTYDIVFLTNPGAVTEEMAQALKSYVDAGGNIVIFPGSKTDPNQWKQNATWSALLPASLGALRKDEASPAGLQGENFDHPITSIWNNRSEGSLSSVRFGSYFPLEVKPATDAKDGTRTPAVILRMANGSPAAVEISRGTGHVVLFNSTATPQWNNLALHPGFVPLMQRTMGYLSRLSSTRLVLGPGETFALPVAMELLGKDFSVIRPGKDTEKRPAGRVELEDQKAVIRFRDTDTVGGYRIFIGDNPQPEAVFAVQMDPAESDLRQAPVAEVQGLAHQAVADSSGSSSISNSQMKVTKEFWTLFIWLAAAFVLLEAILAHRFSVTR